LFVALLLLAGCATGSSTTLRDAGGRDAQSPRIDAGVDAGPFDEDSGVRQDAGIDAGPADAGRADAGRVDDGGRPDAGRRDAGTMVLDGGPSCGRISAGDTLTFDGVGDLAQFPASQVLTPGAPVGAGDTFALTWDREYLYIALSSPVFDGEFKPLHVYVEARDVLGAATSSMGKEYDGLRPRFEFSPTHLIAVRRRNDSGGGPGPYNGVYTASSAWVTRATPLDLGSGYWVSGDNRTIAIRVPWSALGCPSALRLTAHVVNGPIIANEWKDVVPTTATPWGEMSSGGGYYEIDLSADPAISGWTLRP
jgi:hypothetical protein